MSLDTGPMPVARVAGEYRFSQSCKLCGTRVDFTSAQIGEATSCPDCFSPMEICEPGPGQERRPLSDDRFDEPESLAMEATPAEAGRLDSPEALKQRADQFLEKAAAALRAEQREEQDGRFSDAAAGRLLSVFSQGETLTRLAALSFLGVWAMGMFTWQIRRSLAGAAFDATGVLIGAMTFGAMATWLAALAAHCAAMFRGSGSDLATPIPWPGLAPQEWLFALLRLAWAIIVACLPGLAIGGTLVVVPLASWLAGPAVLAIGVCLLPFVLLSMARRNSPWSVYDPELAGDLLAAWPATVTFYQATLLLALVNAMVFGAASLGIPWLAIVQGPFLTASAIANFRLLGWLNIALITPPAED